MITTKVYYQTFNDHIEEFALTKLALVNTNWGGTFDSAADGTFKLKLSRKVNKLPQFLHLYL